MHFQISLSLWVLQVIKDLLCVRDVARNLRTGCYCCLSNFTWNQLCWSFFFSKVAWLRVCNFFALTALDMVLNTPLSHKRSTQYYNADVCKDPNYYKNSRPEVFCKKGVLRNFAKFTGKHLCQSLFFSKVASLQSCNFI